MCWPCLYAIIVFSRGNCLSCVGPVNILSLSSPEGIVYHVLALLIFYHCLLLRELFILCWPCLTIPSGEDNDRILTGPTHDEQFPREETMIEYQQGQHMINNSLRRRQ
jgi:hypothetical protein